MILNRRDFLLASVAAAGARAWDPRASQSPRTRLILLGTAGGPRPRSTRSAPAQAIVIGNTTYVVDCGDGVARQLVAAGIALPTLRHVLITHHHSDHNADYGTLLLIAWAAGLRSPVDTWGPPPIARMTDLFLEMSAADIEARVSDEGRPPLRPLVRPHELRAGGVVFQDENVRVTAAVVQHPPMTPAFAYRFDARDRSVVISGDTSRSDSLIELARSADVLVHEAMMPSAVDRLVASVPNAPDLRRSILSHHTSAEDAGRVADAARVKTLVLSHLVPAEDATITDAMWIAEARKHFGGRVVVGRDLMEL